MAVAVLQEKEYWRIFHLIRGDVEAAVKSNQTFLAIDNLIVAEPELHLNVNRFADFWTLNSFALATTFFIAFGRLFDRTKNVLSVEKLLDFTVTNPGLFSKAALRERKLQVTHNQPGTIPDWLDEAVARAWEPTSADLMPLRAALAPYCETFKKVYGPIRHNYYAHRSKWDEAAISALFSKTQIGEVNEILRFLHTLIAAIQELAINGTRPDLANFQDYDAYVARIKRRTEEFIRQLP
ncbi:MAG: hypothetical protein ABSG13_09300 [Bryobacteraceae bacterium]|jgi:hypothetical protein